MIVHDYTQEVSDLNSLAQTVANGQSSRSLADCKSNSVEWTGFEAVRRVWQAPEVGPVATQQIQVSIRRESVLSNKKAEPRFVVSGFNPSTNARRFSKPYCIVCERDVGWLKRRRASRPNGLARCARCGLLRNVAWEQESSPSLEMDEVKPAYSSRWLQRIDSWLKTHSGLTQYRIADASPAPVLKFSAITSSYAEGFWLPTEQFKAAVLIGDTALSNALDAVVCSLGLEKSEDPVALLLSFHRLLKPGGRLFLEFNNRDSFTSQLLFWMGVVEPGRNEIYQFNSSHVWRLLAQAGFRGGQVKLLQSEGLLGGVGGLKGSLSWFEPGNQIRRLCTSVVVADKEIQQ